MKVIVAMDGDGHFRAAQITNRKESLEVIQSISDGEYFDDVCDMEDLKKPQEIDDANWESYLINFVQRGTCEILNI